MTDREMLEFIVANMATKVDLEGMASKEDMQSMKMELYDEIIRAENAIENNNEYLKTLNSKYDTLLLKYDKKELLLRLINRQANEVDELKNRLEVLEKKIS